jgi:hypothetical protein
MRPLCLRRAGGRAVFRWPGQSYWAFVTPLVSISLVFTRFQKKILQVGKFKIPLAFSYPARYRLATVF